MELVNCEGPIAVVEGTKRCLEPFSSQAKEAIRIARTSFKFGEASLLDVLDVQRVLWQTFQAYAEARFELSVALTELERLVGKEL